MKLRAEFTVSTKYMGNINPPGYTRTTQMGKFVDKAYKRYAEWKEFVRQAFVNQCTDIRAPEKQKSKLSMMIYYKDKRRSDPSNVYKGVEDALGDTPTEGLLYNDDKFNIGDYDFDFDKENPRVEIKIYY